MYMYGCGGQGEQMQCKHDGQGELVYPSVHKDKAVEQLVQQVHHVSLCSRCMLIVQHVHGVGRDVHLVVQSVVQSVDKGISI